MACWIDIVTQSPKLGALSARPACIAVHLMANADLLSYSTSLTDAPSWQALQATVGRERPSVLSLFQSDPDRFARMSHTVGGLFVDFSKQPVTAHEIDLLIQLARECGLETARHALFAGEPVNISENKPALHMALRAPEDAGFMADGNSVGTQVHAALEQMLAFAEDVRSGRLVGHEDTPFEDIVHIGIGGSDLGPRFVTSALRSSHDGPRIHFVANLDPVDLDDVLGILDQKKTLIIIASKTFTTEETMTNARRAKAWLADSVPPENLPQHFAAISTNLDATQKFGVLSEQTFEFWDWVGGRYSLWSALGLPIALAVGADCFRGLLAGAWSMDQHFRDASFEENLPVLMGLIGIFNTNLLGASGHAVLPYGQRLDLLPRYLQQLEMESNGKGRDAVGMVLDHATCGIVFGQSGTNGQHAFYQLIHQGTGLVSCDFIGVVEHMGSDADAHTQLLAHLLAQGEAMMKGRDEKSADQPHSIFPGNRPVSSILMKQLNALYLGQLLALYEHKVFVQSVLWGTNPFDQWGVELGKSLAKPLREELSPGERLGDHDPSTSGLLAMIQNWRNG